jgi:tRNA (adenine57-N1/adenine58-N1)-methyltransferase
MPRPRSALLEAGEAVLFIDRKERQYLRILRPGVTLKLRDGRIEGDSVIGLAEGSRVATSMGDHFLVLRPTYAELVLNLPRQATVIYPKDVGLILTWGDIRPGATVLEAGVGPGALTIALLRAVGAEGRVISYECRADFARIAAENVARYHGEAPNWRLEAGDVYEALPEHDLDRVVLDVPEPWRALEHVAAALRPGGVFLGYLPTILQVKSLADALERHAAFGAIEIFESLLRSWRSRGQSLRPEHRMVAHTGFLTLARRLA